MLSRYGGGLQIVGRSNDLLLRADPTNRYLINGRSEPVLVLGDSPHVVLQQLSASEQITYFAACRAAGINACWIDILGDDYFFNGRGDWGLVDGTDPFTSTGLSGGTYDFTTPNPTFFAAVDAMLTLMATYGLVAFFNVMDQAGNMAEITTNGSTRVQSYGTFLGNRYKNVPNLVWFVGNDFQTYTTSADVNLTKDFCDAILAADSNHLMMVQLDYPVSGSLNSSVLRPIVSLSGAYTYYSCYSYVRKQFEHASKTVPVCLQETWYPNHTFQDNGTTLPPSNLVMRKQAYWSTLAGALAGYLSGNDLTDGFNTGWETAFTVGYATYATQLKIWKEFFTSLAWYSLVPDFGSTIITAGRGSYHENFEADNVDSATYVTMGKDAAGSLLLAYCPASTTITVDMTKMKGSTVGRWFDPTNATYTNATGTPFANSGTHNFATPGNNSAGSPDWVLRLDA